MARWERRRVVRWKVGRLLVLFKCGEHRVSPRFYVFVSDLNRGNKRGLSDVNQGDELGELKIFLFARRYGKTLLKSTASC